jgi:hypothetical protein
MKPDDIHIDIKEIFLPSEKVISREIEGELIIVPIEDGVADFEDALYSFNTTGRRLWDMLSPETSVETICTRLSEEFKAPIETIQADVVGLMKRLYRMGIIEKKL